MCEIQKIHIIGMGALGLLYGNMIIENGKNKTVQYIMDKDRAQKYSGQEILCNESPKTFDIICEEDATPADLLIVAVKATGLKAAIRSMRNSIGPETVIISVLNGIDSEQMIGEEFGFENIIYSVAQGMDAMKFGNEFQFEHSGELRIGTTEKTNPYSYQRIKAFFDETKIAYTEEKNILQRLWIKFMLNVGINQVCMAYGITYGQALAEGEPNRVMIAAMREVIALANAEGIPLTEKDLNNYIQILSGLNPDGMPSMAQDRVNKKNSEVESFAGTVIRLAQKHALYVPSNRYLFSRVKEIEASY